MTAHEKFKQLQELKQGGFPQMPILRELPFDWSPMGEIHGICFENCTFGQDLYIDFEFCKFRECTFIGKGKEVLTARYCEFMVCTFEDVSAYFDQCGMTGCQEIFLGETRPIERWSEEYWELFSEAELKDKLERSQEKDFGEIKVVKRSFHPSTKTLQFTLETEKLGKKRIVFDEHFNVTEISNAKRRMDHAFRSDDGCRVDSRTNS